MQRTERLALLAPIDLTLWEPGPVFVGIAGESRSGTTLLGLVLGSATDSVYVGESRNWATKWSNDQDCSCGAQFRQCKFWAAVFDRVGLSRDRPFTADPRPSEIANILHAATEVAGVTNVIDSSKSPDYLVPLAQQYGEPPLFLHVLRDPRGCLHSRLRGWPSVRPTTTERRATFAETVRVGASWRRANSQAAGLTDVAGARYLRVRYEDLASDPLTVTAVLRPRLGEPAASVSERVQHVPSGNPTRRQASSLEIVLDESWPQAIPRRYQAVGYVAGLPWTHRAGYAPFR